MRLILLLIVIVGILALVQSKRHGCKFGGDDWFNCVVDSTIKEYYSSAGTMGRVAHADAEASRASAM
ncbi:MAG: hypothetical protein KDJ72_05625 [Methyloceanibacter sp.]|uniref:hypothetical protein n=1 Tax=Methyloceanibacter sp. TaxID=1965321 RepID=UPI001D486627|nr:hypothetical protein [Methyloceanibacter sp.]MCB1442485.1 hypothetical protein [Methyloceanibacter sp.]